VISYALVLLLTLVSTAVAQTTTTTTASTTTTTTTPPTCDAGTYSQMAGAASHDPEWDAILAYAQRKHFDVDVSHITNVTKCTTSNGQDYYIAELPNLKANRAPAALLYNRIAAPMLHAQLVYQKGAHVRLIVTQAVTRRLRLNPDGSVRQFQLLDFAGHRIRSESSVAPQSRRRFL
jgi:hypothetical protein